MAQRRFWNWKDDDLTLDLNSRELGIIEPGLYRGFDKDASSSGLNLILSHTATGIQKTKLDKTLTSPIGIWITKQGTIVTEDATMAALAIAATTTHGRIDLIVGTHEYSQTVGGLAATYSVIQGTASATPVAPALTQPNIQTILGVLVIPPSTSNISGMTYTKSKMPRLGNAGYDYLSDLADVTITNATNQDMLVYYAGEWKNWNTKSWIQTFQLNMEMRFSFNYNNQIVAYRSGSSNLMGTLDSFVSVSGGYALHILANIMNYNVGDGVLSAFTIPASGPLKYAENISDGTIAYLCIDGNTSMQIQFGQTAPTGYAMFKHNTKSGTVNFSNTVLKITKLTTTGQVGVTLGVPYWLVEEIKDYDSAITSIQQDLALKVNLNGSNFNEASHTLTPAPAQHSAIFRNKLFSMGLTPRVIFHARFYTYDIGVAPNLSSITPSAHTNISNISKTAQDPSGSRQSSFIITQINSIPSAPSGQVYLENFIVTVEITGGGVIECPISVVRSSPSAVYMRINDLFSSTTEAYYITITSIQYAV